MSVRPSRRTGGPRLAAARGVILAISFLLSVELCRAEEAPPASAAGQNVPRVLLVMYTPPRGGSLRAVIADALQWRLARSGLAIIVPPDDAPLPDPSDSAVLVAARGAESDFAVTVIYELEGQRLDIALVWFDVRRSERGASVSAKAPVDLTLDQSLIRLVDELVSRVSPRTQEVTASRALEAEAKRPPPPAPAAPAASLEEPAAPAASSAPLSSAVDVPNPPEPAAPPGGTEGPEHPEGPVQPEGPVRPEGPAPAAVDLTRQAGLSPVSASPARFSISIGAAPVFPVGRAASYFSIGLMPTIRGEIAVPLGGWRMTLGALSGALWFHAEGSANASENVMVPLGLSASWYRDIIGALAFVTRLSGGPALFVMQEAGGTPLRKLLPYVMWGVGIAAVLGPGVNMSAELVVAAFFERTAPIVAYMPSVHLSLRG